MFVTCSLSFTQFKRERNREHAKRSRQRKKSFTDSLQGCVQTLKDENEKLRTLVFEKLGPAEGKKLIKEQIMTPAEKFIAGIQASRVLDATTIQFLSTLRKDVELGRESDGCITLVG